MPCTAPPASWPSTSAGLIARPTSCSTTCRSGTTRPVSGSSETSESVAPKENDGCGLSKRPDTSPASASAIPSSRARARSARQATRDRVTRDHRCPAGERAEARGDVGRVVVVDLDRGQLDAELVGGDLREDGLDALAERGDTDPDDDRPVVRDGDGGVLERPDRAELDGGRDADPDVLPRCAAAIPLRAQRVVARRREQPLEAAGEVAALVHDRRALGPRS